MLFKRDYNGIYIYVYIYIVVVTIIIRILMDIPSGNQPRGWEIPAPFAFGSPGLKPRLHQNGDILWMEEILHTWDGRKPINNGINHLLTGAGFLPSTV